MLLLSVDQIMTFDDVLFWFVRINDFILYYSVKRCLIRISKDKEDQDTNNK